MGTLKLQRKNEYSNRLRKYRVYIDEIKVGEISNGESKTFELTAGRHNIVCKIDWCSSPTVPVEISSNEVKTFRVGGFKHANWMLSISLVTLCLLPLLKKSVPEFKYLYYLVIPVAGLLIYYITVGRKKYLTLTET